jgi:hypothetical protein
MDHELGNTPDTVEQRHVTEGENPEAPDVWDIYSSEMALGFDVGLVDIDDQNDLPQNT